MARLTISAALALGVLLAACSGDITSSDGNAAALSVVVAEPADGPAAAPAAADSVVVILSGPTNRRISAVPGETVRIDGLPVGTYTVRLEAYSGTLLVWEGEDVVNVSANATATATIVPTVLEHLPVVEITEPGSDAIEAFDGFAFLGSASDVEDGDLSASIAWSSDQDGPLGTGGTLTPTLSVGVHVISATVQDQAGQSVSASVSVSAAPVLLPDELCSENPAYAFATFADSNLERAVRSALSLGPSDDLPCGQLAGLTTLNAEALDVADLSGMQNLVGLDDVWLADNLITDVGPLSGLSDLGSLDVWGNSISDLSALSGLTSLTWLDVGFNQISDVSPLTGLTGLEFLLLEGNQITDVSPFEGLTSLVELDLGSNPLSNIQPLLDNSGLGSGDLVYLDDTGVSCVDVAALQLKGVTVVSDCTGGDNPPTVTITEPSQDTTVTSGDAVTLAGTASDPEDGDLTASIDWDSDLDGVLGTGASLSVMLSEGTHTVTATVHDQLVQGATDQVTITVAPSGATVLQPDEFCGDFSGSAIGTFTDSNLEGAVRSSLGVGSQDDLTCSLLSTLTNLDASNVGVSSLTGAQNLTGLINADLTNNVGIADLGPLSGLTGLTTLLLANNVIVDVTPLSGLTNLETLVLESNDVVDVSPLSGLTALTDLRIPNNQIIDISALSGLTNLTTLVAWRNAIDDIGALAGLTNLTLLNLGSNDIADVSALSGLSLLTSLIIDTNQISDISPLSGLTSLETLHLYDNQITDITALDGLTSLTTLYLDGNEGLSDIQPLLDNMGLGGGDEVDLSFTAVSCADVASLEDNGVLVTSDCELIYPGRIAFVSQDANGNRRLVVMDSDTRNRSTIAAETDVQSPAWSPDGTRIGYDATGTAFAVDSELHLIAPDGTNHEVTSLVGAEFAWAPNGTDVVFVGKTSGFDLYTADVNSAITLQLTTSGQDFDPSWSPDGSTVAYESAGNILVVDASGFFPPQTLTTLGTNGSPAWSGDATRIAFESDRTGNSEIWVMDADGTNLVQITDNVAEDVKPAWSPDGNWLAFGSDRTGDMSLYVVSVDGTIGPILLQHQSGVTDNHPTWAPN